jgi:hypothetical protein
MLNYRLYVFSVEKYRSQLSVLINTASKLSVKSTVSKRSVTNEPPPNFQCKKIPPPNFSVQKYRLHTFSVEKYRLCCEANRMGK